MYEAGRLCAWSENVPVNHLNRDPSRVSSCAIAVGHVFFFTAVMNVALSFFCIDQDIVEDMVKTQRRSTAAGAKEGLA